jgi:hypothetical protein
MSVSGQLTVSRASVYEEATLAAAGCRGSFTLSFCTSKAICAILRSEEDEESGPKETAWNEIGLLNSARVISRRGK